MILFNILIKVITLSKFYKTKLFNENHRDFRAQIFIYVLINVHICILFG